ncbi:putative dehydrogenase [Winogradskyella psychrotolerans RS-3]|uniref:Putative dehydrogenase n=1 Tax=Winogradskyella psychrotolerans RS-3 TaxID=641526 RepID=S7VJT0_9FLAO|nr:alpha/beta fold hydrolase [Winogradskyella psychrotolerans]EPR70470.1 putative dehydrogenase [Winogradskyella psychrotolerans RS-3]
MTKPIGLDITTPLGHHLSLSVFKPNTSINKSIIISSATGVLQHYYYKFATYFSELGYTVYTFDYSGIGKSNLSISDLKQSTIDLKAWGENDQASVVDYAKSQNPTHKIIIITHSIGGQILAFNKNISQVDAIITVASQSGYWKLWKGFERFRMFAFWYALIPTLTPLFSYFPAKKIKLFENLPKQMVYQWSRWGKHKDYMLREFDFDDLQFKNFNKPLLALSFTKDKFAPKASVDWLAEQFIKAKLDRQHIIPDDLGISNVGHFGFFRSQFKASLWNTTHEWMAKHT